MSEPTQAELRERTRQALIAALLREKELIEALEQARKEIERLRKGAKRK